ncbi:hypothetical protein AB0I28_29610 [Phytomonospora sp. NPDC050363]|uniref:hypothetical protein n=1 Tax=Phytomonospora sp. NPDC050363 TaxID=3155642 RepID=UPI0033F68987
MCAGGAARGVPRGGTDGPGVALLAGEAGIGKSRILAEFAAALPAPGLELARWFPRLGPVAGEHGGKHPLFVEAPAQTGDRTPEGLRELLLYGPRALPDSGRQVLRAAAVAGGRVGHRLLETVSGLSGAELDEVLRGLIDAGLPVQADDGFDFRQALIREAVYQDLLPGERIRLHTA